MSGEWLNVSFCSNGTSMISLIIPQNGQLSIVNKMLTEEMGTAARIKSRVNRQSVQSAISSVQQRLKLYRTGQWCVEVEIKDIYHVETFLNILSRKHCTGYCVWYKWYLWWVMSLIFLTVKMRVCFAFSLI